MAVSPYVSDDVCPDTDESSPQSEATTAPVGSDTEASVNEEPADIEGKPIPVDQLAAHVAALRDHQDDLEEEFKVSSREISCV